MTNTTESQIFVSPSETAAFAAETWPLREDVFAANPNIGGETTSTDTEFAQDETSVSESYPAGEVDREYPEEARVVESYPLGEGEPFYSEEMTPAETDLLVEAEPESLDDTNELDGAEPEPKFEFRAGEETYGSPFGAVSALEGVGPDDEHDASGCAAEMVQPGEVVGESGWGAAEFAEEVTKPPTYRIKPRLEHPDLANIARLQEAVSAAQKALNVGVDSGEGVLALQSALRKLHYRAGDGSPIPLSGVYDAATQFAVAALQRDSGIPYPTGRQAGPKTLSALDDRLLKGQPKPDDSACITYRPGEREAAKTSPGKVADHGQELRLYNFAVASPRAKPEHERAVNEFVQKYSLFDPDHSEWQISEVVGFSDAVDNEEKNADLRATRAADVRFILTRNGVPDTAMAGVDRAASLMEYERGCTPGSRSWDRSVVIRLRWKRPKPHPAPRPKPDTDPDWQPAGVCKAKPSTKWSIRGNASVSSPTRPILAVHGNFTLTDRISGKWRVLSFSGTGGQIGASFPLTVGIDNATDFETTSPQYFENFEGQGAIIFGEAMFVVGYAVGRMLMHPHTVPEFISGSGFQLGLGADVTFVGGKWYFDPALGMTCHGGVEHEIEPVSEGESITLSAGRPGPCTCHEISADQSRVATNPVGVGPAAELASSAEPYEVGVVREARAESGGAMQRWDEARIPDDRWTASGASIGVHAEPEAVDMERASSQTSWPILLQRNSTGRYVAVIQASLNAVRAVPVLKVDGVFGPQTEAAVRYFQGAHRLVVDGIVGPETKLMLDRENALHSVGQGADIRDVGTPCHTPVAPGPDDATFSATAVANATRRVRDGDESSGVQPEPGAPAAAPPPAQPRAPDLVVQLTTGDVSDALAAAHSGGAQVVKVLSPDDLRDLLARRKNIGRLVVVSHATSTGEIRFDIGTALVTVKLDDLAAKLRRSAHVREIVFVGCSVGNDPDGLTEMKAALSAVSSEGTNCHLTSRRIAPPTSDGVAIDNEQKYQALSPQNQRNYDHALRQSAVDNRGNCIVQLRPGQTLAQVSDAQLRALAMRTGGALITQFAAEDGTCWKDMKFGGPDRCHRVQR